MQSPVAAARSLPRHVVRLSAALAALLGRAEGAELPEDEFLVFLREAGLITSPSPLLGRMIELPAVFAAEVLPQLKPSDLALVARVGRASRAVVVASGLPRAGTSVGVPLNIKDFVGSVELLCWAKENGCPWVARTCALIARNGYLQVLRRARELDCPWDACTCAAAAEGGHQEVLVWAREHGCPWSEDLYDDQDPDLDCCALAAAGGHLEVLRWLRGHDCPWDKWTCFAAAEGGHLEVLVWAQEHGAPWDENTRQYAAEGGHLEVLQWLDKYGAP
jgi:hypothetical protein